MEIVPARSLVPPLGLITVEALSPKQWEIRLVDLAFQELRDEDLLWANPQKRAVGFELALSGHHFIRYVRQVAETMEAESRRAIVQSFRIWVPNRWTSTESGGKSVACRDNRSQPPEQSRCASLRRCGPLRIPPYPVNGKP